MNDNNNYGLQKLLLSSHEEALKIEKGSREHSKLYKELLKLGIRQDRAEKALAACAYKGMSEAIHWLIKHSKDPLIFNANSQELTGSNSAAATSSREFILLLCPVGRLANEISHFFKDSRHKLGLNEAHYKNSLPYMKLTPYFRAYDSHVIHLHKVFEHIFKVDNGLKHETKSRLHDINLEFQSSSQILLLYPDYESEHRIKELVASFCQLASKCAANPITAISKQFHLRLAYKFNAEHKNALDDMVTRHIKFKTSGDWEIRLYSRDARLDGNHLFRVKIPYKSKTENLKIGDYIYVNQHIGDSNESGIIAGVNHSNGENICFTRKIVERVCETEAWQLHKSQLIVQHTDAIVHQPIDKIDNIKSNNNAAMSANDATHKTSVEKGSRLKFVVMRHAERVDLVFGAQWIESTFDRNGVYRRNNLNMPRALPKRPSRRDFINDSPITEIGKTQSRFTGEGLHEQVHSFQYCYVSPSLRCIQTAHYVLEAMNLHRFCKLRIEPTLFEYLGWYEKDRPTFLAMEPLVHFGYNVDVNYKPFTSVDKLQKEESYNDYYGRSYNFMKHLLTLHHREEAQILIVGHAGTLEVCTRQVTGHPMRENHSFNSVIRKVPYLGCCLLSKNNENQYEVSSTGIHPMTHSATFNFDASVLKNQT